MRVLPREHGATVIWAASVVLALGSLRAVPAALGLAVFALGAVLVLLLVARTTASSVAVLRMERNPVLLPALSGALTLIVPLGHLVMAGTLPPETLAAWLVFLAYTVAGVVLTRIGVRAILKRMTPPIAGAASLAGAVLLAETLLLAAAGWLGIAALGVLALLLAYALAVRSLAKTDTAARVRIVRRVGFAQSANLLAAAVLLAVVQAL